MITAERLREILHYDATTGVFTRKISMRCAPAGVVISGTPDNGYLAATIERKKYRLHRLAWLYMTGEWPQDRIDHKDLNRANNAWTNLRAATHMQNMQNTRRRANNTSGFKGASWHDTMKKWRARIHVGPQEKRLGYFDTPEEAHAAYADAARRFHGEFARTE